MPQHRSIPAIALLTVFAAACGLSTNNLTLSAGPAARRSTAPSQQQQPNEPVVSDVTLGRTTRQYAAMNLIDAALRNFGWHITDLNKTAREIRTDWRPVDRNPNPQSGTVCDDGTRAALRLFVKADANTGEFHLSGEFRQGSGSPDAARTAREGYRDVADALEDAVVQSGSLTDSLTVVLENTAGTDAGRNGTTICTTVRGR